MDSEIKSPIGLKCCADSKEMTRATDEFANGVEIDGVIVGDYDSEADTEDGSCRYSGCTDDTFITNNIY